MLTVTDPSLQQTLAAHQAERDGWLAATRAQLENDERVDAAWLFGSLGRDDGDELSDTDLFVIVNDAEFDELIAHRYDFLAQVAQPLLILEAPQNWPPGGVYNMALYPGASGPHQVDWYWVRRCAARLPMETRLLFDRIGLAQQESPTHFDYAPVPERTPEEVATQNVNSFWVMWLIACKYIARYPWKANLGVMRLVPNHLRQIAAFVGVAVDLPETEPPHPSPAEKIARLRELERLVEPLLPQAAAKGASIPEQIVPYAHRYLALVEAIAHDAGRPTT
ncbi:MAG: nucleotidyltransferase domain-containing protein [Chloroflexi bacterium]|nr:nucleotidyltransferase domain-containing protein [Chloroflexota bacterium]